MVDNCVLLKFAQETFPIHYVADVNPFSHQSFAVGCTNFEGKFPSFSFCEFRGSGHFFVQTGGVEMRGLNHGTYGGRAFREYGFYGIHGSVFH